MRILALTDRLLRWFSISFLVLGALATFLMMFHIGADAIMRTFLHRPIVGTLEIVSTWYMVSLIFLPLGYLQLRRGHINVELFTAGLGMERRVRMEGVLFMLSSVFVMAWCDAAFEAAIKKTEQGESLDAFAFEVIVWPTRWLYVAALANLSLCLFLTGLQQVLDPSDPSADGDEMSPAGQTGN